MGVLEYLRDRRQHAELADALELTHAGALERRGPEHRGLGMELFEVLDDGERLGEVAAVVELEDGEAAERVLLEEPR